VDRSRGRAIAPAPAVVSSRCRQGGSRRRIAAVGRKESSTELDEVFLLVSMGYITHGPPGAGDRRPIRQGAYLDEDLARFSDYRITAAGRTEADRVRRQRRDALTDGILGGLILESSISMLNTDHQGAIATPLEHLRSALDAGHYAAAVGAAKDLVGAACKVALELAGQPVPNADSLPAVFKLALDATGATLIGSPLGRSLTATVQRLAELRNTTGSRHGRSTQPDVDRATGRLAAGTASGIAIFLVDR
jgi:hypothetical protein